MSAPITREERDALIARAREFEERLYPAEGGPEAPSGPKRVKMMDTYYQVLAEYGDRLPRVPMSRCPHTKLLLKRSLDPFGLDGYWWHKSRIVKIEEPAAPPTFMVPLGALHLNARVPEEVTAEVIPGPEVPFVVPRLMGLPGMKAVVSRLELARGDIAHVIAYFASDPIHPQFLHQHWLRQDLWYPNDAGGTSWLIQNDAWDFELAPWIERGALSWIAPGDAEMTLRTEVGGCPYLGLPGAHEPQSLSGGSRILLDAPNGVPIDPYAEP